MTTSLTADAESMTGDLALPRDNGEFVFDEPWQGQAFGLAVVLVERLGVPWREFQQRLITAIERDPQHPYYESWAAALESLAVDFEAAQISQIDQIAADKILADRH